MSCEYCEYMYNIPFRYAEGILGYLDVHIEDGELFATLGNDEAVMRVNFCPKCGEDLRKEGA